MPKFIRQHKEINPIPVPTSPGTFLDISNRKIGSGIGWGIHPPEAKGKERRPDMRTGQGNGDALTWSCIREISNESNSLSTLLPDAGRPSKTQLAHVDSVRPIFRVRALTTAIRETGHQAPAGGNPFPSFTE